MNIAGADGFEPSIQAPKARALPLGDDALGPLISWVFAVDLTDCGNTRILGLYLLEAFSLPSKE